MKISFIIPAYNAEKYIANCLVSCYEDKSLSTDLYEVIVVDDGSLDGTAEIVADFQRSHLNLLLISKKNGGVSSARNAGLKEAKGEYVIFIDSDDRISSPVLSDILQIINQEIRDLIIYQSLITNNDRPNEATIGYPIPESLAGKTLSGTDLFKGGFFRGSVCGVVFNRLFIERHSISFIESIKNGEDSLFMTMCFIFSKNVKFVKLNLYLVTETVGSASRNWHLDKIVTLMGTLKVIKSYIASNNFNNDQLAMLNVEAYSVISNALYYYSRLSKFTRYRELRLKCVRSGMYPIKLYGIKHFVSKVLLLNWSFDLFFLLVFLKTRLVRN